MDLSYEARWLNLRRELEEAAATLEHLTHQPGEAAHFAAFKLAGIRVALTYMDETERATGPRA